MVRSIGGSFVSGRAIGIRVVSGHDFRRTNIGQTCVSGHDFSRAERRQHWSGFSRCGLRWIPVLICVFAAIFPNAARAQDERSVKSPDGQLEFRLFTSLPDDSILNCLAYQVWLHGKPILDTSYLGLDIEFQEPLLGENVGLSADRPIHEAHYNGLWADYLQTSTTGRRLQFEVRVWNDGVAFRYIVPRSALLFDLAIEDDVTQFHFADDIAGDLPAMAALPFVRETPAGGWIGIYNQDIPGIPKMELKRFDAHTMVSHLPGGVPDQLAAFQTKTPWIGPWHIVVLNESRERITQSEVFQELE